MFAFFRYLFGARERVYRLEVLPGKSGHSWYFHGRALNGEIVFASEAYTRREDAERAVDALLEARLERGART